MPPPNESQNPITSAQLGSAIAANQGREERLIGGIDVRAAPNFARFEESNVWLAEQLGEQYVRACGRWDLFEKSRQVDGFEAARLSWSGAWVEFHRRNPGFGVAEGPFISDGVVNACGPFFSQLERDPSNALQDYQFLVAAAAANGDIDFFLKLSARYKRGQKRKRKGLIAFHLLSNWLHGFLWLMSAVWGSYVLEAWSGQKVSQDNYLKLCQRLKLIGWESAHPHPLIEGYIPKTGAFIFRRGWTDLKPEEAT